MLHLVSVIRDIARMLFSEVIVGVGTWKYGRCISMIVKCLEYQRSVRKEARTAAAIKRKQNILS
jgi:hypothetical protein